MDLYGAVCVFNEAEYVCNMLDSLYPICDYIVIVEACTPWYREFSTAVGGSTDGTTEILENYPDPGRKLRYLPLGFVDSLIVARNLYLQEIPAESLILVTDGDEGWIADDIRRGKIYLSEHPEVEGVQADLYQFWGDFRTYWHFPNNPMACRLFRRGTIRYGDEPGREWLDHPSNRPRVGEFAILDPPLRLFHYQNVRSGRRIYQKVLYYTLWEREQGGKCSELCYPGWGHLSKDDLRVEIALNHYMLTQQLPSELQERLRRYEGPCPDPFAAHPYATQSAAEIFNQGDFDHLLQELLEKSCASP